MGLTQVNITPTLEAVVRTFFEDINEDLWGYLIKQRTGIASATIFEALARLERAGWVIRTDGGEVSGGPARVVYRLNPKFEKEIRLQVAAASLRREKTAAAQGRLAGRLRPAAEGGTSHGV